MNAWLAAAAAVSVSCLVAGVHAQRARGRLLDVPGERSSHATATPTGGGIALLAGMAASVPLMPVLAPDWRVALALAALLGLLGLADDLRGLPVWPRLAAQLAASTLLIGALAHAAAGTVAPLAAVLAIVVLAWLVNVFNFMDGVDGLAGGHALFMTLAAAVLAHDARAAADTVAVLACAGAAVAGFLVWNRPPARLFMGDTGSLALGFLLAGAAALTSARAELPLAVWLILWAPLLADTGLTLAWRAARGERLWAAHRDHAYQKLARRFGSHRGVTLGLLLFDCAWLLPLALLAARAPRYATALAAAACLPPVALVLSVHLGARSAIPADDPRLR